MLPATGKFEPNKSLFIILYDLVDNSLCPCRISVGDILAVCELEQPVMAGYDVSGGRAVLADYITRVKAELNPHYDEVSAVVFKMRDKFGGSVPGVYPPSSS